MPIYDYECTCCSNRFELKRSFSEDGTVSCPSCGGSAQRIFSAVPIIFKGSGFYVTDSRGNNSASSPTDSAEKPKADSAEKPKTGSADQAKADSTGSSS